MKPLFLFVCLVLLFACGGGTLKEPPPAEEAYVVSESAIDNDFNLKTAVWSHGKDTIRIKYASPVNNSAVARSIHNELSAFLYDELFCIDHTDTTMTAMIKSCVDTFKADSIFSPDEPVVIDVFPILFHNDRITSVRYVCCNSLGGSLNARFDLCHVFRNSDGQRLFFDDIVTASDREELFRIAYEEWERNSEKMRWYNPFFKGFNEAVDEESYDYDEEYYQDFLSGVLKRNFCFTPAGLVLSYNLHEGGGQEFGKTGLLLPLEKIRSLIQL